MALTFDYKDSARDRSGKGEKLRASRHILQLFEDEKNVQYLFLPNLDKVFETISANIFRPLPRLNLGDLEKEDTGIDQEQTQDPAWPYLQDVYQLFYKVIASDLIEQNVVKKFINTKFVQSLVELFDSEDEQERDFLKQVLHKLYAKVVARRKMIRSVMNANFFRLIHETDCQNGAGELLDIYASIISGYAVPLRTEHITFFKDIIIPLHKVQSCASFFEKLVRCAMLFIVKDVSLIASLIEGLLKYWPFGNAGKEILFLGELAEIMQYHHMEEIEGIEVLVPKLFNRLTKCITSTHVRVQDAALCLFEIESFVLLMRKYKEITYPMLVPKVMDAGKGHWLENLALTFTSLRQILQEVEPEAYASAIEQATESPQKLREELDKKWNTINERLKDKRPGYEEPALPYRDDALPKDYNIMYQSVYDRVSQKF